MPSYYPMSEYKFVKFRRSQTKGKKYDAILENKETKRTVTIPFGDNSMEQYKDTTGLGLYNHKNHNDNKRRKAYIARHSVYIKPNMYSAGWYSMNFLW